MPRGSEGRAYAPADKIGEDLLGTSSFIAAMQFELLWSVFTWYRAPEVSYTRRALGGINAAFAKLRTVKTRPSFFTTINGGKKNSVVSDSERERPPPVRIVRDNGRLIFYTAALYRVTKETILSSGRKRRELPPLSGKRVA